MLVLVVERLVATTITSSILLRISFAVSVSFTVDRLVRLILSDNFTALSNQFRLLHSAFLHREHFFLPDSLHVSLHGTEDEVTCAGLERLVGLLADQDLARRALRAHTGSLVDRWADQRKLRLGLTNDASNDLTSVDTNLDA